MTEKKEIHNNTEQRSIVHGNLNFNQTSSQTGKLPVGQFNPFNKPSSDTGQNSNQGQNNNDGK